MSAWHTPDSGCEAHQSKAAHTARQLHSIHSTALHMAYRHYIWPLQALKGCLSAGGANGEAHDGGWEVLQGWPTRVMKMVAVLRGSRTRASLNKV